MVSAPIIHFRVRSQSRGKDAGLPPSVFCSVLDGGWSSDLILCAR
jgi:hypothetical protein